MFKEKFTTKDLELIDKQDFNPIEKLSAQTLLFSKSYLEEISDYYEIDINEVNVNLIIDWILENR